MVVEMAMLGVGMWLYVRTTRAKDRIGLYTFVAYVALLLILYFENYFSAPPTGTADIVWGGLPFEPVVILWAWWFDRHRVLSPQAG